MSMIVGLLLLLIALALLAGGLWALGWDRRRRQSPLAGRNGFESAVSVLDPGASEGLRSMDHLSLTCGGCGGIVPQGALVCPHCSVNLSEVKCLKCGFSAPSASFLPQGRCPSCRVAVMAG